MGAPGRDHARTPASAVPGQTVAHAPGRAGAGNRTGAGLAQGRPGRSGL